MSRDRDLARIREALEAGARAIAAYTSGDIEFERKSGRDDPVTEADRAADRAIRDVLPRGDEGWLSEESVDDRTRLTCRRVWVVDPIDGTRQFIDGVPEWSISIGLVEDGEPVAGGVMNPARQETVLGYVGGGVTLNGTSVGITEPAAGEVVSVLASRSEIRRGEWERYGDAPLDVRGCGSVAYKLALVAAGRAHATWTLRTKSEWDVAGGAALVRAAGGRVTLADGSVPRFNQRDPEHPSFVAAGVTVGDRIVEEWLEMAR